MELFLIRHAQSQNNAKPEEERVEDPDITELGHQQAHHLAQWIPDLGITKLFSSPFLRTLQTTEYIRRTTNLRPTVRIDLHESGGCMKGPHPEVMVGRPGMNRSLIQTQFPGFEIEPDIDGNGWWNSKPLESETQVTERAQRLVQQTCQEFAHTDERVAYVMHADFKVAFLSVFHQEVLDGPYNVSVSRITIRREQIQLAEYNNIQHVPRHLVSR